MRKKERKKWGAHVISFEASSAILNAGRHISQLLPPWREISRKFVRFPAERWSDACSKSELCPCVQLVGETFLWLSVFPNRLGQEGVSEGSQRGSPVLPLIKHISVVSQKTHWKFIQWNEGPRMEQWRKYCTLLVFALWPNTTEGTSASQGWMVKCTSSSELGKSPIPQSRAICHEHNGTKHERDIIFYSPWRSWRIKQTLSKSFWVLSLDRV